MKIVFLLLFILLLSDNIKNDAEKVIYDFFGNNVQIEMIKYEIPFSLKIEIEKHCRQRFISNNVYIWKVFRNNKKIAVAMMDNVIGKSLPITFVVIFDLQGKILSTEIIKYRESYGGAVQEKNWLNQFKGKDEKADFKIGKDISSISGATISANSVSIGVKKLSLLYSRIRDEL